MKGHCHCFTEKMLEVTGSVTYRNGLETRSESLIFHCCGADEGFNHDTSGHL